ncbi:DUF3156 family protein [Klebsiella pneumoniae subsp. pneumoniae]|nr:DUF3156 family protein [Klebsiella pneumoniae subsp. pneumoniae]
MIVAAGAAAIEPWAASEVVCKMPPLRRYLRLEAQQRMLLLSVCWRWLIRR